MPRYKTKVTTSPADMHAALRGELTAAESGISQVDGKKEAKEGEGTMYL